MDLNSLQVPGSQLQGLEYAKHEPHPAPWGFSLFGDGPHLLHSILSHIAWPPVRILGESRKQAQAGTSLQLSNFHVLRWTPPAAPGPGHRRASRKQLHTSRVTPDADGGGAGISEALWGTHTSLPSVVGRKPMPGFKSLPLCDPHCKTWQSQSRKLEIYVFNERGSRTPESQSSGTFLLS